MLLDDAHVKYRHVYIAWVEAVATAERKKTDTATFTKEAPRK